MPDLELYFTIQKKANTNEKQTNIYFHCNQEKRSFFKKLYCLQFHENYQGSLTRQTKKTFVAPCLHFFK